MIECCDRQVLPAVSPRVSYPPLVQCSDLSVCWDGPLVLDRLNLTLPAGTITTLIGPSGSGKSTLVRHLLGLREPVAGTVTIGGHDVADPEQLTRIRRNLSALLSGPTLYDGSVYASLPVRENLLAVLYERQVNTAARKPSRRPRSNPFLKLWTPHRHDERAIEATAEFDEQVQHCLERFNLTRYADLLPGDLSAHTRRRLGLACALATDVPLYLLDDLDGALDAQHRGRIIHELLDTHERTGATILATTHDLDLAETISDQVAVLAAGRIVAMGDPRPVLSEVERWYALADELELDSRSA